MLFDRRAGIDTKVIAFRTPLLLAAEKLHDPVLRILLDSGQISKPKTLIIVRLCVGLKFWA